MLVELIFIISILVICGLVLYILIHKNNDSNDVFNHLTKIIRQTGNPYADSRQIEHFRKEIAKLKNANIDQLIIPNVLYSYTPQSFDKYLINRLNKEYNVECSNDDLYVYYMYIIIKHLQHINDYVHTYNQENDEINTCKNDKTSECETHMFHAKYITELDDHWRHLSIVLKLIKTFEYPYEIKPLLKNQFNETFVTLKNYQSRLTADENDTNCSDLVTHISTHSYHLGFQTVILSDNRLQQIDKLNVGDKIVSFGNRISTVTRIKPINVIDIPNSLKFYCINDDIVVTETQLLSTINGVKSINTKLKVGDKILKLCYPTMQIDINWLTKCDYTYKVVDINKIQSAKVNTRVVDYLYQLELDNSHQPIINLYPCINEPMTPIDVVMSQSTLPKLNYISYVDMYETFNKIFEKDVNEKIVDYITHHSV